MPEEFYTPSPTELVPDTFLVGDTPSVAEVNGLGDLTDDFSLYDPTDPFGFRPVGEDGRYDDYTDGGGPGAGRIEGGGGGTGYTAGYAPTLEEIGVPDLTAPDAYKSVTGTTWSGEQMKNAQIIVQVGKKLGASQRDIQIALMTAMQESTLRNLDYGDRDSVGLFQQRNAWGSFEDRTNPAKSAEMFFTGGQAGQRGLFDFEDRDSMSLTQAAQAVQVSAYPDAYAKWETEAEGIYGAVQNGGSSGTKQPWRKAVVAAAQKMLGTPYVWGGTSYTGVDCSGLIQLLYGKQGINLPRVSYQQANTGERVGLDQLQPGDLVAWDNSSRNPGADHIAIYVGNGQIIEAPRPGTYVQLSDLYDTDRAWGVSMSAFDIPLPEPQEDRTPRPSRGGSRGTTAPQPAATHNSGGRYVDEPGAPPPPPPSGGGGGSKGGGGKKNDPPPTHNSGGRYSDEYV